MKTLAFILAFFASSVFAQENWVYLTATPDNATTYSYRVGSFKQSKTESQIIIKAEYANGDNADFRIVKMTEADCKNEFGSVRFLDTSNKLLFSHSYVKSGGTIAQFIGDIVCGLREQKQVGI